VSRFGRFPIQTNIAENENAAASPILAAHGSHAVGGPSSGRARVRRGLQGRRGAGVWERPRGHEARGGGGEPGGGSGGEIWQSPEGEPTLEGSGGCRVGSPVQGRLSRVGSVE
jgi:hypothetical protein